MNETVNLTNTQYIKSDITLTKTMVYLNDQLPTCKLNYYTRICKGNPKSA